MNANAPGWETGGGAHAEGIATADTSVPAQLRTRKEASLRLEPFPDGRHDPLLGLPERGRQPSTFGLTEDERRAHARHLWRLGWPVDEIQQVLVIDVRKPPEAAA